MADLLRENGIRGYQNIEQVFLPVDCVYMCFDLTAMLPVKRNILSILLYIIDAFKVVSKIVISEHYLYLVCPSLSLCQSAFNSFFHKGTDFLVI